MTGPHAHRCACGAYASFHEGDGHWCRACLPENWLKRIARGVTPERRVGGAVPIGRMNEPAQGSLL